MEEEVCEAISQMEHNKALGPDKFPEEFCQKKLGRDQRWSHGIVHPIKDGWPTAVQT
jgi:hypothetical protein